MSSKSDQVATKKQEVRCCREAPGPARRKRQRPCTPHAALPRLNLHAAAALSGLVGAVLLRFHATPKPPSRAQLLDFIAPLQRGAAASPEQKARVEAMAAELERLNPTRAPLASPLLSGRWQLEYTTSDSILGTKRLLRPTGPIYQFIDGPGLWVAGAVWVCPTAAARPGARAAQQSRRRAR
jgi:hypothetical protein